ncbi:MAG: hypothetical protein HYZ58_07025 [Acidobacteria bacterium]|nr:hypothetical protein [Acidobacteriota bacterium]
MFSVILLMGAIIGLQIARERQTNSIEPDDRLLYVRSGPLLEKVSLSYDAVMADVYWIRTLQHYGGTRLSKKTDKRYDLLYPLLDITTSLDPKFAIAYRFGAIFLAEGYPDGPGRPDQAIELLKKGMRAQPQKWQYLHDAGFIYYWWLEDFRSAAEWFDRASRVPGSPWWLKPLTATTMAQGGDRASSRLLWQQMLEAADNDWLRQSATLRLAQLTALDHLDRLSALVARYKSSTGHLPSSWDILVGARLLSQAPIDPAGVPYHLDPATGAVELAERSPLHPLPAHLRRH